MKLKLIFKSSLKVALFLLGGAKTKRDASLTRVP